VHGEERKVDADEESSKVDLRQNLVIGNSKNLIRPVVKAGKDGKHCPHRKNVVKVRNYIVGIVKSDVKSCICKNDAGYSTNCEKKNKSDCKQHGSYKSNRAPPHSRKSAKDFNSCWNSNDHRCRRKVRASINIKAYSIHVVSSDDKSKQPDGEHRVHHAQIAKNWFTGKRFNNMANNSKSRKDKNINLGMTEKSEQVLIQNRVTAARRVEKNGFKVAIH